MGCSLPAVPILLLALWYDHIRDGVSAKGNTPAHGSGISVLYEAGAYLASTRETGVCVGRQSRLHPFFAPFPRHLLFPLEFETRSPSCVFSGPATVHLVPIGAGTDYA